MQLVLKRFSCPSGSLWYASLNDNLFGPLSHEDRLQIELGQTPEILTQQPTNAPACPLKSQKGVCLPEAQTSADTTSSSQSVDLAGPGGELESADKPPQHSNGEQESQGVNSLLATLLPPNLATHKGQVARNRMVRDYWTTAPAEDQEALVARSLELLNRTLHHSDLTKQLGHRVYLSTTYADRVLLSGITDPELILALDQAQNNVMAWLTLGAASPRIEYTANNYESMIRRNLTMHTPDINFCYDLVLDCARALLWSWKSGSVFGLLHKYLHRRVYTRLQSDAKALGIDDDGVTLVRLSSRNLKYVEENEHEI